MGLRHFSLPHSPTLFGRSLDKSEILLTGTLSHNSIKCYNLKVFELCCNAYNIHLAVLYRSRIFLA